jgi:transposase-like protein
MVVRRTEAQWEEIVDDYKKSGQSMAAWCRENGLSAKTLGFHMNKGKKAVTKRQRTSDEWRALIEKRKSSGLSMSSWCRANGINENTMWSAESRFAKIQASEGIKQEPSSATADWVEVNISESTATVSPAILKDGTSDVRPLESSSVTNQKSAVHAAYITKPVELISETGKDASAYMRIRMKGAEIEVNNDYPVEKLMTLMKGLFDLC